MVPMRTGFRRHSTSTVRLAQSRPRTVACAPSNQSPNSGVAARSPHTNSLNVIAVRVNQKGCVVAGAVIGAQAWATVITTAALQPLGMKAIDRTPIRGLKRDVYAGTGRSFASVEPECGGAIRPEPRA